MTGPFTGTRHLVRLVLRRDRVRLPLWMLGVTAMTGVSASAVQGLYDTPENIAGYGATVGDSAAGKLMNGTPYAVDTIGGITAYEVTATAGIIVALMVVFLVVRHTRAEEESGTAELLRSTVLGRHAAAAAALLVAAASSVLVGVLDWLVLAATGLPVTGSALHGVALAAVGLSFTAVAALAAQLSTTARGALGIAGAVLALLFVLRGVGAVAGSWLVWTSPFGWQQELRVFGADERWWPLLVFVVFTGAVFAGAVWLTAHRDFGAGLLQPRAGSPRASGFLSTSVGLAFQVQRGLFVGWALGLFLLACLFGALGREVVTMVESNPEIGDVFGGAGDDIVRGYFAFAANFMAVLAGAYAVTSALRLRHEEAAGRAEGVLATGLSRTRWAAGGIVVTVLGCLAVLLLMGLGMGGTHALVSEDATLFWPLVGALLAAAPAVLLLAAVALLLHGVAPRLAFLAWALFALAIIQAYLGDLLDFPGWLAGLSPFWHLPLLPVDDFEAAPALVLTGLVVVAAAGGVLGLRRRDVG